MRVKQFIKKQDMISSPVTQLSENTFIEAQDRLDPRKI